MQDHKEFQEDIQMLVNLTAALESAKEALNERSKETAEKYEESDVYALKPAQLKKIASMVLKQNAEEEKAKAMEIFDILEQLED